MEEQNNEVLGGQVQDVTVAAPDSMYRDVWPFIKGALKELSADANLVRDIFRPFLNSNTGLYKYTVNGGKLGLFIDRWLRLEVVEDQNKERNPNGDNLLYIYAGGRYLSVTRRSLSHFVHCLAMYAAQDIDVLKNLSLSARQLADVVSLWEFSRPTYSYDSLDSDEFMVCLRDGVLDIRTMELLPHDENRFMTRRLEVNWSDRMQPTPVFDKYINDLADGDEETVKFLKTWIGICISSLFVYKYKTSLLLIGDAHAGKSQYLDLVAWLVGEVNAATVDPAKLSTSDHASAKLKGKRLMITPELSSVKIDDMSRIKTLLGGDRYDCNAKFRDAIDDRFKGGAIIVGNDFLKVGGKEASTPQILDRFVPVVCTNVLPKEKRDAGLQEKMRREAPGIVYQCLELAHDTLVKDEHGEFSMRNLPIPAKSIEHRHTMARDNDPVFQFKEDALVFTNCPNVASVPCRRFYEMYAGWFRANYDAKYIVKRKDFMARLAKKGVVFKTKRNGGLVLSGYQLNEGYYRNLVADGVVLEDAEDSSLLVPGPIAVPDKGDLDTVESLPEGSVCMSLSEFLTRFYTLYCTSHPRLTWADVVAITGEHPDPACTQVTVTPAHVEKLVTEHNCESTPEMFRNTIRFCFGMPTV